MKPPPNAASRSRANPEAERLAEAARREKNWQRWGPYLSARQWGTVREDYSADGDAWRYFPHEHARSRAYRWGEDGLLGFCDREGRLCFALALWNEADPILKERLFGLSGPEGNHGEDVKECFYFLDCTPTYSYCKALYKYPQARYPYEQILEESRRRGRLEPEYEIGDTGIFDQDRYFDAQVEYAKAGPDDILIRIQVANRAAGAARLHILPTLWFRNTWSWGRTGDEYPPRPRLRRAGPAAIEAVHPTLGRFVLTAATDPAGPPDEALFTENETNGERLFGAPSGDPFVKDAFHDYLIGGRTSAVNPAHEGTKAAFHYRLEIPAGGETTLRLRLRGDGGPGGSRPSPAARRPGAATRRPSAATRRPISIRSCFSAAARPTPSTRTFSPTRSTPNRGWSRASPMPVSSGPGSSTPTWCGSGWRGIRGRSRLRPGGRTVATVTGPTCTTAMSSRCPTPGNIHGTRPGTSGFTCSRWRGWTRISPRRNSCSFCGSGTCTRTARSLPTNGHWGM